MTDPQRQADEPSIPEPGAAPEPRFDAPAPPAPAVDDPPQRNTEL